MNNNQIFMSYRRDGGYILAGRLADRFRSLGYNVFYDVDSMHSGTFNTQISDAIAQCSVVLVVLPPNALKRCDNDDDWVRQEVAFALKKNKKIIPVLMNGFEFPQTLPDDIDKIRYMEGVVESKEYFEAMVEKIESLMKSHVQKLNHTGWKLETKEYYKISAPLISPYKRNDNLAKGYLNIGVFTEKLRLTNPQFAWQPPVISNSTINSFKEFVSYYNNKLVEEWYKKNEKRINYLRNTAITLKNNEDLYFYNNALLFAMGSLLTLPKEWNRFYPDMLVEIFCYCTDLPSESFGELEVSFRKDGYGYKEFKEYIPSALYVWATPNECGRMSSDLTQRFDTLGVVLFDFMTEIAILILDTCKDPELNTIRSQQIRCYYKWLRKHKIFLPKELQKKISKYL